MKHTVLDSRATLRIDPEKGMIIPQLLTEAHVGIMGDALHRTRSLSIF
jgi:hypothetical protein